MSKKEKTCCFSGHRDVPAEKEQRLKKRVVELIKNFANNNQIYDYYAGGALGFDTIAEIAVLEVKKEIPEVKLHLAIPCENQSKSWSVKDKRIYNYILSKADSVTLVQREYDRYCMFKRNRFMVDKSSFLITYYHKKSGGTAYTRDYAMKNGLLVINLR